MCNIEHLRKELKDFPERLELLNEIYSQIYPDFPNTAHIYIHSNRSHQMKKRITALLGYRVKGAKPGNPFTIVKQ